MGDGDMAVDPEFEKLVKLYYRDLYRFGFSLTRSEADACDLTQQTFYIWAIKGHQLRDQANVKSWLFSCIVNSSKFAAGANVSPMNQLTK